MEILNELALAPLAARLPCSGGFGSLRPRPRGEKPFNSGSIRDPEWSKNWNALKRRDVRLSQSAAAVSLSQVSPG